MTATLNNSAVRLTLIEYMAPFSKNVDRENRIIRNVMVIGLSSGNSVRVVGIDSDETYDYLPEALQDAIPKYQGVVVNLDHPDFTHTADGERRTASATKTAQRFGRLVNVRFVENKGLMADLEYLASHPLAEMILEAAERMPETLAMSHNARGNVTRKGGKYVVDEIGEVRSVDLIAEKPGTTHSLFENLKECDMACDNKLAEQEETEDKKLTEMNVDPNMQTAAPLQEEDDMVNPEEEMIAEQDEAVAAPEEMIESGFRGAINALLDDDSLDDATLVSRLGDLIKKRSEVKIALAGGEGGDVSEQEEEQKKEDVVAESLSVVVQQLRSVKQQNRKLLTEAKQTKLYERARNTLASKKIDATPARIKAIAALEGDAKGQAELMESFKPTTKIPRPSVTRNRPLYESVDSGDYPKDAKSFAAACKN